MRRYVRGKAAVWLIIGLWTAAASAASDWPMWGGTPDRNMVSPAKGLPVEWNVQTGKHLKWRQLIGSQNYGNVVVSGGKLFVGTNNGVERNPKIKGDKGVVMCFRAADGTFLWQAVHDKLKAGRVNDWPRQGICSSPCVDGDRVYYVSNRCELVCADTEGFYDGQNDGPFQKETYTSKIDADFVWKLDMIEQLDVFPHNLATSSPLVVGDLVYIVTGNGVDEGHLNLQAPRAPSFIAVNKNTGKVVWESNLPGTNILHGQWSSPAYGVVDGQGQVIFPGGDGWLYALDPKDGRLIWKFNCNPKDSVWQLGGRGTRNNLIATPVFYKGRVIIGVGQDPEHGEGPGHLYAIDATKTGDVTESGRLWHYHKIGRTMSTAAIHDGLLYVGELVGYLHCIDVETGKQVWKHDLMAAVWGSALVADGKVYIGDEDGDVAVFKAGRTLKLLAEQNMGSAVYTTPVAVDGTLYITNRSTLFAISAGPPPSR